jgi:hypothetical protein
MDIVSPNCFTALETCTISTGSIPPPWTPESVKQFEINLIKNSAKSLCDFVLKEKGKKECDPERCFWHK